MHTRMLSFLSHLTLTIWCVHSMSLRAKHTQHTADNAYYLHNTHTCALTYCIGEDERDAAFAAVHSLPVIKVLEGEDGAGMMCCLHVRCMGWYGLVWVGVCSQSVGNCTDLM